MEVLVPAAGRVLEAVDSFLEPPNIAGVFEVWGGLQEDVGVEVGVEVGGMYVAVAQVDLERGGEQQEDAEGANVEALRDIGG